MRTPSRIYVDVLEDVIASVGFYAFEKLTFHPLVSLKCRSSHFSAEIRNLLVVELTSRLFHQPSKPVYYIGD